MYINCISLTHSSVGGQLGWSRGVACGVAFTNSATANAEAQAALWWDTESFGNLPKSGIAGHDCISVFSFWMTLLLIPIVAALVYTPAAAGEALFSHPHRNLLLSVVLTVAILI